MAGGFIMRKAAWVGGKKSDDPEMGTVEKRAKFILKTVANLLIDTGTGWALDKKHNATVDDMMTNTKNDLFVLFLTSTHGEKLMIGYSIENNVVPAPFGFKKDKSNMCKVSGLFTSMIPAGSNSVFGQTWLGEGFIPTDATLVYTCTGTSDYSSSMAYKNEDNTTYHTQVVTNGSIISFRVYKDLYYGTWWFVGPIISTLAHQSMDTLPTAKMATLQYMKSGSYEGDGYINFEELGVWKRRVSSDNIDKYDKIDIFRADGEHIQSADGHGIFVSGASEQTLNMVANSSITGLNRWAAIYIGVNSGDPTTHYIVKGDGMKGYLDTNFLRYVNNDYPFGQTFDDGNFVYIGYGVAMGWDPSNGPLNG